MQTKLENFIDSIGLSALKIYQYVFKSLDKKGAKITLRCLGWALLLTISIYIGTQASLAQQTSSDQFISTFIFRDIFRGVPMISVDHTNIIKLPLLWLQGYFGYTSLGYVALNIFFIFSSIALWIFLSGKIFGKEFVTLSLFIFSAVLFGSTTFAINITMTTIRHIEFPLGLLFALEMSKLVVPKRNNYLYRASWVASILALLILNDKYFLYTLVPASLMAIVIFSIKNHVNTRQALYSSAAVLFGAILGLILPRILELTGCITIVAGYASPSIIIGFDQIFNSVTLAISQTIGLFGGLFFGQPLKLRTLSMFIYFITPIAAVSGIIYTQKYYAKNTQKYFTHLFLISWTLFAYASYIFSGMINASNSRYLTLIVYVGVTYCAWLVFAVSSRHNKYYWLIPAICLLSLATITLSYPRVSSIYTSSINESSKKVDYAKKMIEALNNNNVEQLVAPFGYFSIKFLDHKPLNLIAINECATVNPWSNNSSWIYDGHYHRSAYIYDKGQYELVQNQFCTEAGIVQSYGEPDEIVSVPSIINDGEQAKLYIYNYDIRSEFNISKISPLMAKPKR